MKQWNELLSSSTNLGRGLEEAQDILEFNNQAEKIEAWIRDKVQNHYCVAIKFIYCSWVAGGK